jgi:hypothetical protein
VLDSGYTNHITGEKHMFTSFEENDCPSDTIMFGDNSIGKVLGYGKIAITTGHTIFEKFYLLILWTTICCPCHNFVRWDIIICSLIKV